MCGAKGDTEPSRRTGRRASELYCRKATTVVIGGARRPCLAAVSDVDAVASVASTLVGSLRWVAGGVTWFAGDGASL